MHMQLFLRSSMHRPHRYSNSGSVGVTASCTFEQHVVSKYKLTNISKSHAADGAEVPPAVDCSQIWVHAHSIWQLQTYRRVL